MATQTKQMMPKTTTPNKPPMRNLPEPEQNRRNAFVGRIFQAGIQSLELHAMYLGQRLGYYAALESRGPLTAKELAQATKTNARYAREWLEQQAVAGILDVVGPSDDAEDRAYGLPAPHAEVLLDEQGLYYLGFMPTYGAVIPPLLPKIEKAYRTGGGVTWGAFGQATWQAQAAQNRPFLTHLFVQEYLAKIPSVAERLARPGAHVADIACGAGWSSIAIARAYPGALVEGFDMDKAAIAQAKRNAQQAGVADRVTFHARDAAQPATAHKFDVVTIVEALHDMSKPVNVLKAARKLLAPGGSVVVVDEKTQEAFTAPGPDPERFFYAASLVVCLPNGLSQKPSAATGAVMRPATLKKYAQSAGFANVEVLPLEHDFFRFYRLSG